ncbi:oxidoreductase domain containing protein [Yasminevirus sp. GU-2018]|uniref:Oxidoreductase domain containing protein n=1 Tax=Yasminevirus sp. GU-2018 TaxID=2420051 RepID=A0A5K0U8P1_9VIRU|nr:oxidoreductase domain containing protein [Yasminevirus sp. GU-2018]
MEHESQLTDASKLLDTDFDQEHVIKTNIPDVLDEVNKRLNFTIEKEDVFLLDNMLTESECQRLIAFASDKGYGQTGFTSSYRGYLRLLTDDDNLAKKLWERIKCHIPDKVVDKDGSKWVADGLNRRFRWAKYPVGSHFSRHCDSNYKDSSSRKSFYTVNVYLNSGFGDGRTRFFENDLADTKPFYQVEPEPGRALVFTQPDKKYLIHDGETVSTTEKYLMRTDVMYRREK